MKRDTVVFVVDDDDAVRRGLAALLGAKGYAVETFPTAEAFLLREAPRSPACLLADVRMPGMSGLALQQSLKGLGCRLPIVFLTGHGDVPMAVEAIQQGAFDFLEKPCRDEQLLDVVRRAIERDAERRRSESAFEGLTQRERQVLERVLGGKTSAAIAVEYGISRKTVEFHRAQIMRKLGVRSRAPLVEACKARAVPQ